MQVRPKTITIFVSGFALGALILASYHYVLRIQEIDLYRVPYSAGQNLEHTARIVDSYKQRDQGMSFEQFMNCVVRDDLESTEDKLQHVVPRYTFASDTTDFLVARLERQISYASEVLAKDVGNRCPEE